jgi:GDP-L-fucose synthase
MPETACAGVRPGDADRPRLLVTGGAGLVGRNVAEHPAFADWTVATPSHRDLDLTDYAATLAYMRAFAPDFVVHAAGRVGGIQANMAHPVDFLVANVDIGRNVVLGARNAGVKRLLNLGSSCIYPREGANPLREDMLMTGPLEPTNEGYALAKIVALRLCEYLNREDPGLRYKTFLPCNLYGRYDHFDKERSHLLPAIIVKIHEAMRDGAESVEIWGDGTARREFMYAGDLADAIAAALADFDAVPDMMNVGLGHDYTILEYYEAVRDVLGWSGRFTFDTTRPTGMRQKLVDVTRQRRWNWAPRTSLRDGIAATYRYYLEVQSR